MTNPDPRKTTVKLHVETAVEDPKITEEYVKRTLGDAGLKLTRCYATRDYSPVVPIQNTQPQAYVDFGQNINWRDACGAFCDRRVDLELMLLENKQSPSVLIRLNDRAIAHIYVGPDGDWGDYLFPCDKHTAVLFGVLHNELREEDLTGVDDERMTEEEAYMYSQGYNWCTWVELISEKLHELFPDTTPKGAGA